MGPLISDRPKCQHTQQQSLGCQLHWTVWQSFPGRLPRLPPLCSAPLFPLLLPQASALPALSPLASDSIDPRVPRAIDKKSCPKLVPPTPPSQIQPPLGTSLQGPQGQSFLASLESQAEGLELP